MYSANFGYHVCNQYKKADRLIFDFLRIKYKKLFLKIGLTLTGINISCEKIFFFAKILIYVNVMLINVNNRKIFLFFSLS
jgi:hypothetical protein